MKHRGNREQARFKKQYDLDRQRHRLVTHIRKCVIKLHAKRKYKSMDFLRNMKEAGLVLKRLMNHPKEKSYVPSGKD